MEKFTKTPMQHLHLPLNPDEDSYLINIVRSGIDTYKTRPASLTVGNGNRVVWINKTDSQVEVVFYRGDTVFEGFPGPLNYSFSLDPGAYQSFVVNAENLREYSYHVFCITAGKFADGDSDPRIIVR
jgi:hypothetical protein